MSENAFLLAAVSLVILMKIVCFILGYLTIRLGYKLVASGVKGEFKFSAKMKGLQADLASISPGLFFVLLGAFLIGYGIYVKKPIIVDKVFEAEIPKPELKIPQKPPSIEDLKQHDKNEIK
jgi:hypothetical protein